MADKVLLVGSGVNAPEIQQWNLQDWIVCAIHNAWKLVPDRCDYLLHSPDFPISCHLDMSQETRLISIAKHIKHLQADGFAPQGGFTKVMFIKALSWVCDHLEPRLIGCVGCNQHYPAGNKDTFYGKRQGDPISHVPLAITQWLYFWQGYCCAKGITLLNYSGGETLLPFSRATFPGEVADG